MKADIFKLDEAKVVSDELKISQACKIMYVPVSDGRLPSDKSVEYWHGSFFGQFSRILLAKKDTLIV